MSKKLWLHVSFLDAQDKAYADLKDREQVRAYFKQFVPDLPVALPDVFETLHVEKHVGDDKDGGGEAWSWGRDGVLLYPSGQCADVDGWLVIVDGKNVHDDIGDVGLPGYVPADGA